MKLNQSGMQYQTEKTEKKAVAEQSRNIGTASKNFHFNFENDKHYDEFMRRPRSQTYIEAMQIVDMMSSTDEEVIEKLKEVLDEEVVEEFKEMTPNEILEELRLSFEEEFATAALEFKDVPVPTCPDLVLCKCYISGCDVHAISKTGFIVDHYQKRDHGNEQVERGRRVYYEHPDCRCVEVYPECIRVVMEDGSVETVKM